MGSTPIYALPYPEATDPADVPLDMRELAERIEAVLGGFGAWQAYTPVWTATTTAPVLGNGVLAGRYCQIGKQVTGRIRLELGSTSTMGSGFWRFSLPVAAAALTGNLGKWVMGMTEAWDVSAGRYFPFQNVWVSTTTLGLMAFQHETGNIYMAPFTSTTGPLFIPAAGDWFNIGFAYEAA
jgi:hypothetical protein